MRPIWRKCFRDYRVYSRYNFQGLFQLLSNQCCVAFNTNAALLRVPPQRKNSSKHLVCFALLNHEKGAWIMCVQLPSNGVQRTYLIIALEVIQWPTSNNEGNMNALFTWLQWVTCNCRGSPVDEWVVPVKREDMSSRAAWSCRPRPSQFRLWQHWTDCNLQLCQTGLHKCRIELVNNPGNISQLQFNILGI